MRFRSGVKTALRYLDPAWLSDLKLPSMERLAGHLDFRGRCIQRWKNNMTPYNQQDTDEFAIVSARISPATMENLQRYAHFVNKSQPGLNAKIGTVVRMLIVQALEHAEKEHGPLPPVPPIPTPKKTRR